MTSPRTPRQWNAGDPEPGPEVQLLRFQRDLPHPYLRRSLASDDGGLGGWALETHPDPATWSKSLARTWGHRTEQTDLWGPLVEVLPETPEPPQVCSAKTSWATADDIRVCALPDGHEGPHRQDPAVGTLMWWQGDDPEAAELPDPVPASQSVPAVPVSSTGGKETGEAAETATEALSAVGVGSLSEAIGLALNDTYAGLEFEDPTFESGTMAIMAVLREHLADWRPPLPEGGEEIGDDVIVHFEGRPVVGRPLSVKVGWEGDQFVELPRDFAVPASSPLPDSETEPTTVRTAAEVQHDALKAETLRLVGRLPERMVATFDRLYPRGLDVLADDALTSAYNLVVRSVRKAEVTS